MNLFDQLVTEALKTQPILSSLKIVVEKELLHHDILRILNQNDLLTHLTFIGGTCLRTCYGGIRLSEDLDFTGGKNFTRQSLSQLGSVIINSLQEKYGLNVIVKEPIKEINNVETWKIKIETRPEQKHLPTQRINIDICSVPSYEKRPMLLLNPYGVEMGTSGLVIHAQSREEIYTDKLLAFAFHPNRLKYRDLWDIAWLHQLGLKPKFELLTHKLRDRQLLVEDFLTLFNERQKLIAHSKKLEKEFYKEMHRFLPSGQIAEIEKNNLWSAIIYLLDALKTQSKQILK